MRDPLAAFEDIGRRADGSIARLDLGPFRPYLVTRPEHVQHVLRDNAANYPRRGMMWEPFSRLVGDGIAGEGEAWAASRATLQPAFAGRHITALLDEMAATVDEAVADLAGRAARQQTLDLGLEMTRIVQRVLNLVFFGGRIRLEDADRLGTAVSTAMMSFLWRMMMPFVPLTVPMPGDRAFRRSTRTVEEILGPIVAEARRSPTGGGDVVSLLLRGTGADGAPLSDRQVRDDIVGLWVAGSESTAVALTWLWVNLAARPDVADRLYREIDEVVGTDAPGRDHVRQLRYTTMVLNESLRIHSVGWVVPRTSAAEDVIDGVPMPAGATVLVSPYLTHRLPAVWEDPLTFDPERFAPGRARERHPLAHLPFGAGVHECLGQHFFMVEAALIVAAVLRRFRPVVDPAVPVRAQASLTVRPARPVSFTLRPR
ncbi:cytochrome P450 [Actinoallomurus vinaceus]|uniref:cytochrome P450 n=1 Tax=Actinoallomurus vinaceus TaxID=1080074 RepID=UPI0031E90B04